MQQQLHTVNKLDLEACLTTSKLHGNVETENPLDLRSDRDRGDNLPSSTVIEVAVEAMPVIDTFATVNPIDPQSDRDRGDNLPSSAVIEAPVEAMPIIDTSFTTVNLADLKAGKSFLDIKHHCEPGEPPKPYYSTSITNRSAENLRIDRFATYIPKDKTIVLYSITGGVFSAQQFQEWYELGQNLWIEPGQTVTDPNNHSNVGIYWAYFGTTASGQQFVAGAQWLGKPWWQLW
jgi:hypothetical protein